MNPPFPPVSHPHNFAFNASLAAYTLSDALQVAETVELPQTASSSRRPRHVLDEIKKWFNRFLCCSSQ